MTWVVDTCIILDILDRHAKFAETSSRALESKLDDVLTIAPISYVELAPAFNGDIAAQDAFLDGCGFSATSMEARMRCSSRTRRGMNTFCANARVWSGGVR